MGEEVQDFRLRPEARAENSWLAQGNVRQLVSARKKSQS